MIDCFDFPIVLIFRERESAGRSIPDVMRSRVREVALVIPLELLSFPREINCTSQTELRE